MSITCTRRIQFCAGHRIMGHENKCAHLHGHNYVAFLTAETTVLDSVGRVIDFSVLKDKIGGWINTYWDHGFILCSEDFHAHDVLVNVYVGEDKAQKLYMMPKNPTAENMANYLLHEVGPGLLFDRGVRLVEVTIWETENCYATARLEGVETHEQTHGSGSGPRQDSPSTDSGGTTTPDKKENTLTPQTPGSSSGPKNVISPAYFDQGGGSS